MSAFDDMFRQTLATKQQGAQTLQGMQNQGSLDVARQHGQDQMNYGNQQGEFGLKNIAASGQNTLANTALSGQYGIQHQLAANQGSVDSEKVKVGGAASVDGGTRTDQFSGALTSPVASGGYQYPPITPQSNAQSLRPANKTAGAGDYKPYNYFKRGGKVPGKGNKDSVKAKLTPGEYVIPKDVVAAKGGAQALDNDVQQTRGAMGIPQRPTGAQTSNGAQKFKDGGEVRPASQPVKANYTNVGQGVVPAVDNFFRNTVPEAISSSTKAIVESTQDPYAATRPAYGDKRTAVTPSGYTSDASANQLTAPVTKAAPTSAPAQIASPAVAASAPVDQEAVANEMAKRGAIPRAQDRLTDAEASMANGGKATPDMNTREGKLQALQAIQDENRKANIAHLESQGALSKAQADMMPQELELKKRQAALELQKASSADQANIQKQEENIYKWTDAKHKDVPGADTELNLSRSGLNDMIRARVSNGYMTPEEGERRINGRNDIIKQADQDNNVRGALTVAATAGKKGLTKSGHIQNAVEAMRRDPRFTDPVMAEALHRQFGLTDKDEIAKYISSKD